MILEGQQFSNFLSVAQFSGATGPLERHELGNDPPDLLVTMQGSPPLGVELTSLSVTDVSRQRLDEIRKIARNLTEQVASEPDIYSHLRGRSVSIAEHTTDDTRPRKRNEKTRNSLIEQLAATLKQDFGVADEWPSADHIAAEVARQGRERVEEYEIAVHRSPQADLLSAVSANIQIEIHEVDLRERLLDRITAKDRPENDILLISTGPIDNEGYVQSADHYVFDLVKQIVAEGLAFEPVHLDQVILHHWGGSGHAMVLYQRPGAPTLVDTTAWTHIE
jgi:hypothetical protein